MVVGTTDIVVLCGRRQFELLCFNDLLFHRTQIQSALEDGLKALVVTGIKGQRPLTATFQPF